jgi:hypothetical protein
MRTAIDAASSDTIRAPHLIEVTADPTNGIRISACALQHHWQCRCSR